MAIIEVLVPQLSESVSEATLLTWKKQHGEAVEADEILIEGETDKVELEVPAPSSGVVSEIVERDVVRSAGTYRYRSNGQRSPGCASRRGTCSRDARCRACSPRSTGGCTAIQQRYCIAGRLQDSFRERRRPLNRIRYGP